MENNPGFKVTLFFIELKNGRHPKKHQNFGHFPNEEGVSAGSMSNV